MSTTGSKNSCNQCPQQWLISQFGQLSLNLHIIIMYLHFPSRTGSNNRIFVLNKRINNPKIPQKYPIIRKIPVIKQPDDKE